MGKKDDRLNEIIKYMQYHRRVELHDLVKQFQVSEMTIRRDLGMLQSSSVITNLHGTILYNEDHNLAQDPNYYTVVRQKGIRDNEKERIAKEAAKLVEPGDSIIIDIGTTTSKIIKFLPNNSPITCICFTANTVFDAIKKNFDRLFFPGGYYHHNSQMFESNEISQAMKNVRASKMFVSAAGISNVLGVTCMNQYEVETKIVSIHNSTTKILLADSSKFGVVRNGYFADLKDIDMIITDTGLSLEWREIIHDLNIDLKIV